MAPGAAKALGGSSKPANPYLKTASNKKSTPPNIALSARSRASPSDLSLKGQVPRTSASSWLFKRILPFFLVTCYLLFDLTSSVLPDGSFYLLDKPAAASAAAPKFFLDSNETVRICGITAMLGPYEKSAKEPTSPLDPSCPLFLVTDRDDLINETTSAWTKVRIDPSLWKDDCLKDEFVNAPNNPCDQPYNFNIAKFYKEQPYRVPEIINAGCNVIVWMDGTIRIKDKTFMGHMKDRADRGQNLVVSVHRPARKGLLSLEVENSVRNKKYQGLTGSDFGPFQNISMQYEQYVLEGFTEKWFEQESWWPDVKGATPDLYGMFVTCMVLFDLRKKATKTFLDCWWRENILHSTQDQVSFPYCSWKHKIPIHALPDVDFKGNFEGNNFFDKMGHGQ